MTVDRVDNMDDVDKAGDVDKSGRSGTKHQRGYASSDL